MDTVNQCVASSLDIFYIGVFLGVISVMAGQYFIKLLDLWLGNNQKKLDVELGKAITEMHKNLEEMNGSRRPSSTKNSTI